MAALRASTLRQRACVPVTIILTFVISVLSVVVANLRAKLATAVAVLNYHEAKQEYYNSNVDVSAVCDVGGKVCRIDAGRVSCKDPDRKLASGHSGGGFWLVTPDLSCTPGGRECSVDLYLKGRNNAWVKGSVAFSDSVEPPTCIVNEWVRDVRGFTSNGLTMSSNVFTFGQEANYVGFCLHQHNGMSPRVEFQIRNGQAIELCTLTQTWIHTVPSDWLCLCGSMTKSSGLCNVKLCCTNTAGTGGRLRIHHEPPASTTSQGICKGLEDGSFTVGTKTSRTCVDYTSPEFTYMSDDTGNCDETC